MNRKELIENILETTLTTDEYTALKKEWFRFWQSPYRYTKDRTNLDRTWKTKEPVTWQKVTEWLKEYRAKCQYTE